MELTPELVARCYREEPDTGPNPNFTPIEDSERRSIAKALVASASPGPLWVFAYGSLIWRPEFEVAEFRCATASGWHRSFCLELTRWRGTPALPGLMLALQSGGRCNGVGLRLPENESAEIIYELVKREIMTSEDAGMARWVTGSTDIGPLRDLTFWAGSKGAGILRGLPLETVAWKLAHACGHYGSSEEYLFQTVVKFEEHEIRDRNLWQLQKLVAAEIKRWKPKDP